MQEAHELHQVLQLLARRDELERQAREVSGQALDALEDAAQRVVGDVEDAGRELFGHGDGQVAAHVHGGAERDHRGHVTAAPVGRGEVREHAALRIARDVRAAPGGLAQEADRGVHGLDVIVYRATEPAFDVFGNTEVRDVDVEPRGGQMRDRRELRRDVVNVVRHHERRHQQDGPRRGHARALQWLPVMAQRHNWPREGPEKTNWALVMAQRQDPCREHDLVGRFVRCPEPPFAQPLERVDRASRKVPRQPFRPSAQHAPRRYGFAHGAHHTGVIHGRDRSAYAWPRTRTTHLAPTWRRLPLLPTETSRCRLLA